VNGRQQRAGCPANLNSVFVGRDLHGVREGPHTSRESRPRAVSFRGIRRLFTRHL